MTRDHGAWRRSPDTVCHRAMLDGDCPFTHRWEDGVPYGMAGHQTFIQSPWVARAGRRGLPARIEGGTHR